MTAAIQWDQIARLLWAAPVATIAVAVSYSLLIYGVSRAGEARRTFGELDERANRVANHLLGLGLAPGAKVAIYGWNRAEWVESFFGAFKARLVPINVNLPVRRRRAALRPRERRHRGGHRRALVPASASEDPRGAAAAPARRRHR